MKLLCDEYNLKSQFIKGENSRVLVLSDIAYHPSVSFRVWTNLITYSHLVKPDYILMLGDLIETSDFLDNAGQREFFEMMLRSLSEVSRVIITAGKKESDKLINYLDSLNAHKNICFLNNEQVSFGNFNFLGFSSSLDTYLKKDDEAKETFMEEYAKSGLRIDAQKYNILLMNNPVLAEEDVKMQISDCRDEVDLVVTGSALGNTPGMYDFGRGYLFVPRRFRRWTADNSSFGFLEESTANYVEMLNLSSCKKGKSYSLIKR